MLLAWLFSWGAAIAQDCASYGHGLVDDCCVSMQASTLRADDASAATMPSPPAQPWLVAAAQVLLPVTVRQDVQRIAAAGPVWHDSGQGIPIVFLRLAR